MQNETHCPAYYPAPRVDDHPGLTEPARQSGSVLSPFVHRRPASIRRRTSTEESRVRKRADRRQHPAGPRQLLGFIPNILGLPGDPGRRLHHRQARQEASSPRLLQKVGVDRTLHSSDAGKYVERVSPGASPARLIGAVAFWFIFLFAISAAIGALKIPALSDVHRRRSRRSCRTSSSPLLIFVIAAALAGAVGGAAHKLMGDTPTGKIVRAIAPALILAIATFMVLDQLHIAPQIVTITYAALLGMLALAGALAFGLGGRDVAADMLGAAPTTPVSATPARSSSDMQTGRERAERVDRHQADRERRGRLASHRRRDSPASSAPRTRSTPDHPSPTHRGRTAPCRPPRRSPTGTARSSSAPDGDKIGTIDDIYLDEQTGKPEWLAVRTGLFGSHVSFVPLAEARATPTTSASPTTRTRSRTAPTPTPTARCPRRRSPGSTATTGSTTRRAARTPGCPRAARPRRDRRRCRGPRPRSRHHRARRHRHPDFQGSSFPQEPAGRRTAWTASTRSWRPARR